MRYSRKAYEKQIAEQKSTIYMMCNEHRANTETHKRELEELRKRLRERELDAKATIARASAQLIESLARMLSPGTF